MLKTQLEAVMARDLRHQDPEDEIAQMFRTVGNQVEGLNSAASGDGNGAEGPKVVEEIESLCMNCGENVRRNVITSVQASLTQAYALGSDSAVVNEDPLFP